MRIYHLLFKYLFLVSFFLMRALAFSSRQYLGFDQYVGFDLGTSGARISVIQEKDASYEEVYTQAIPWEGAYDSPDAWMSAVTTLLQGAQTQLSSLEHIKSICVSGTSASCLLVDGKNAGKVTRAPRMYNFDISANCDPIHRVRAMELLEQYAPPKHTALSSTGSLAKLLAWNEETKLTDGELLSHQSDYIALRLLSNDKACGSGRNQRMVCSDWHNCLKLGYDVRKLQWPDWLADCVQAAGMSQSVLPGKVVSPGEPMGTISKDMADRFGLPDDTIIVGGTTDSNAAFFAATGKQALPGTAVTSLGSTLAIKQLSSTYVEDASVGVYSHRFPKVMGDEAWLVGGASNVGCAVLRAEGFSNDELDQLSVDIDPNVESTLSYYPLTKKGERFPIADSNKEPILEPAPDSRREYLHGILQGISDVERDGFLTMGKLGASPPTPSLVWTCGGGSRNDIWSQMRQRRLREAFGDDKVTVARAGNVEASYGAAILAAASFS